MSSEPVLDRPPRRSDRTSHGRSCQGKVGASVPALQKKTASLHQPIHAMAERAFIALGPHSFGHRLDLRRPLRLPAGSGIMDAAARFSAPRSRSALPQEANQTDAGLP